MSGPAPTRTTVLHNPVIRGFAPDPSMVRVGDWYYVANSSFEWFPTIPIHRSRSLATWEYTGHVEGAAPGGTLAGVPDSGGIWAPSLSWDGEQFWMVYAVVRSVGTPYFETDTYITTAEQVSGPWAEPRRIASHGFDPALFHQDGRLWLLNLQNDHRPGGQRFSGIILTELGRENLAPVGETKLLLQHDRLIEGPKLLQHDGWYYLTLAEGGTGFEHGVRMARSRNLCGPYELDELPLLTTRDDSTVQLQKAGHGELVETPDGQWVLCHLTARPLHTPAGPRCTLGRETAIQAITWDEGNWPRLRHGGWHPASNVEMTLASTTAAPEPQTEHSSLGWPWSTLREPPSPAWADTTSRPGWIRLRGRNGPESRWDQSLLAQRLTEHHATAQVTIDAAPSTFTQAAGLILRYDAAAYLSLDLTWAEPPGEPQRGQQWQSGGRMVLSLIDRDENGARQSAQLEIAPNTPVTLGVTIDRDIARFWYTTSDARTPVGPALDCSRLSDDHGGVLRFTGTLVGIHARDLVDQTFTADFSDFRLTCGSTADATIRPATAPDTQAAPPRLHA
ncbi:family 43 glycosylhydrolase [Streptomyces sp. NPDC056708]|uniref:family 43 glycosylhydrolase n=1 Tax=unclassified Streptomyces TaxID=2593676 RepID=UPI0036743E9E